MIRPQILPVTSVMRGEGERDFVDGRRDGIQPQILLDQVTDGRKHPDVEAGERCNGGRHVEIDDAEDRALARFVGNLEEDGVQIPSQNQPREGRQAQDDFQTHVLHPTNTISTKAKAKTVKMTLNATRIRNQMKFSASGPLMINTRLSWMAPISAGISIG